MGTSKSGKYIEYESDIHIVMNLGPLKAVQI